MSSCVLFVDDEPDVTAAMRLALKRQPFSVLTANSAAEGLDVLRQKAVDVVVSDERMPVMAGSEFLTIVRQEFPDVMRIILTGQASIEATIKAVNEAKVFRFLTKPCPANELAACINEALEAQALAGTVAEPITTNPDSDLAVQLDEALAAATVVYQPIYSMRDHEVFAYEALVRTSHPTIPDPTSLIEVATKLDRQFDLDRRVRDLVACDIPDAPPGVTIFVNLLPESLNDDTLFDDSNPLVVHAESVALEITERASLDSIGNVQSKLDQLRTQGFRLVLDDLGAGYAGLTSFATMQPDVVKFDMELVRDVQLSNTREKLISSMVTLCRELGIKTVAEGVETSDELQRLVELGCDYLQGYAIGKPQEPWVQIEH